MPDEKPASDDAVAELGAMLLRDSGPICKKLGLPQGFLISLVGETDWSFVLQLHAVLDAAIAETIAKTVFNNPYAQPGRDEQEIRLFVSRLSVDGRAGKLALASTFNLFPPEIVDHVKAINELRNRYAHDVGRVSQSILSVCDSALLKRVLRFAIPPPLTDGLVKMGLLVSATSTLWMIDFPTRPRPTFFDMLQSQVAAPPNGAGSHGEEPRADGT